VLRNPSNTDYARIDQWNSSIEPLGDGVGDDRLALFLEEIDQALLLLNECVDAGGFVVEEGRYIRLLVERRAAQISTTNDITR